MRMKTLRRLRAQASTSAPRVVRRPGGGVFDVSDADDDFGPSPEVVFDRITGPFGRRADGCGGSMDEET